MSFKDEFRDVQEMVRELMLLRKHNLAFKPGDTQETFLLMSEGLICIVILERFVRAVLGPTATERDTIRTLLTTAVKKGAPPTSLRGSAGRDSEDPTKVRNMILHGNFEQAAKEEGLATVREFFQERFRGIVEKTYQITDHLFRQIDPETGKPNGLQTTVSS